LTNFNFSVIFVAQSTRLDFGKKITSPGGREKMAHLKPTEILARAKEFLQGADYAVQNNCFK
jgi:hypothetical protein